MDEFLKAEFYKGCVFEWLEGRLWIEGRPVDIDPSGRVATLATGERFRRKSPSGAAKAIIDRAREFRARRDLIKQHREMLDSCARARDPAKRWNAWRQKHPNIAPMLAKEKLAGRDFTGFDFSYANLCMADLRGAKLIRTSLHQAVLAKADCSHADFSRANFCRTDLYETNLHKANLTHANLQGVQMVGTDCTGTIFENCTVYGLAAWDVTLDQETVQKRFLIRYFEPEKPGTATSTRRQLELEADDLRIAQFAHLMLNNKNFKIAVDALTRTGVLLLGRFTKGRKDVLEKLRDGLKETKHAAIVFDFDRAPERDLDEMIQLLANMSVFIIADLTGPRSVPAELATIVPRLAIPMVPIIHGRRVPHALFNALMKYPWVLEPLIYDSPQHLIDGLERAVINPALAMSGALARRKSLKWKPRDIRDYLNRTALEKSCCARLRPPTLTAPQR